LFDHVQGAALDFPVNARDVLAHNPQRQQVQPAKTKDRHGQRGEAQHAQLRKETEGLQNLFQDQKPGIAQAGRADNRPQHGDPLQWQIGKAKQPVQRVAE